MIDPIELLGPDGPIASKLDNYEQRQEQLDMVAAIGQAIADKKHLVVEAGTGTGKSFAYTAGVLPFLDENHKKKVVISTFTIALQEQLILKDIPFLKQASGLNFKAVLVKGRGNYLCWRRLDKALAAGRQLFDDDSQYDQLDELRQWALSARDGCLSEIEYAPDKAVWELVRSDPGVCTGRKCGRFESCFYQKARRQIYNADILVVNHALLFTDLAARLTQGQLLPDYDFVILDEAHSVEKVAGAHFGLQISNYQIRYLLNRLYNQKTRRGILSREMTNNTVSIIDDCHNACQLFFEEVETYDSSSRKSGSNSRVMQPGVFLNCLSNPLEALATDLMTIAEKTAKDDDRMEFMYYAQKCRGFSLGIDQFISQTLETECVYWVESSRNRFGNLNASLHASPLDLGPVLKEALFKPISSVILTSATISISGKKQKYIDSGIEQENAIPEGFRYFTNSVGLDHCNTLQLGSPFDYKKQVEVYIEAGLPEPKGNYESEFMEAATEAIKGYLTMTHGKAFILFTSFSHLNKVANAIEGFCQSKNITMLAQGSGTNSQDLLERFRYDTNSVLLGVDSFWQGVDVRGESLSNVIIFKLPFAVPTHPLLQARMERIAQRGGSPFWDYQIPEAVLKLKQGFGRLVRSASDKGIVAILDPRVATKAYGRFFIDALPECKLRFVKSPAERKAPDWLRF
ncbi:MAG: DEAD/DEAH box helicase family protein [Sedimentisphaerales bacterium]|nr:DEAD/DEAH box helicase family protein [Sedimentisphaerales bacterium]MBN2843481.1 DEAD/DEAH box helicase family protein [Sedimentisphaerales bacterium]